MIYIGGGGSSTDEAAVFSKAFEADQRIVIWPWAQHETRWPGMIDWIQTSVSPHGDFPPVTIGSEAPHFGLDYADIIVIPGGNTFQLLSCLAERQLLEALKVFLACGGRVYGGSAGALVLGADVGIGDSAKGGQDANELGLEDTRGLDVLGGCVVYPHYEEGNESWEAHCKNWALEHGVTVIGIAEKGGLEVDEDAGAVNLGPSDAFVFKKGGEMEKWEAGKKIMLNEI